MVMFVLGWTHDFVRLDVTLVIQAVQVFDRLHGCHKYKYERLAQLRLKQIFF